jgi:DHA1 family tetracycline resistance protein-like MFS transporter
MTRTIAIILAVVAIDMMGIGLVMPVLPALLRHLGHTSHIAVVYGSLMAAYAAMQFLFSPFLGALSDRFGRRPVLLASLAGAALDYLVTACAPTLGILAAGRILAGITGANIAVATSAIADVTSAQGRAKRFGQMSAVMGIGLIAGPMIGGLLGGVSLRAPYLAAAGLNAVNAILVLVLLPETRTGPAARFTFSLRALLPSFDILASHPRAPRLVGIYAVIVLAAQCPMSLWILYGQNRYRWDETTVGLSLALYGLLFAISQWFLVGPLIRRFGERGAVILGTLADFTAYAVLGLAAQGWIAFALMPLWGIAGIAQPALQAMISRDVPADRQGRLQGTLVSLSSLIGIPGPLLVTTLYAHSPEAWPGLVWLLAACAYLAVTPLLLAGSSRPVMLRAR